MGRAFRGAGRALRRPWTWLVLLVVGTLLPWFAFLSFGPFGMSPGTGVAAMFDSVLALAPFVATQCALIVLLLALLVPVLEGGPVRLGRLRPPAIRLVGAAARSVGTVFVDRETMRPVEEGGIDPARIAPKARVY